MLRTLIVDDEPHAREVLAHHCSSDPDIAIVGRRQSAAEALKVIETGVVDLMFLDIRMPLFDSVRIRCQRLAEKHPIDFARVSDRGIRRNTLRSPG